MVALAAFVWALLTAAADVRARLKTIGATDPAVVGLCGGLVAFLVSGLFGHPLLIGQVLLTFFLVLGVVDGIAPIAVQRPLLLPALELSGQSDTHPATRTRGERKTGNK